MSEYFLTIHGEGLPDFDALTGALDRIEIMAAPDGSVTAHGFIGLRPG